jgi:hypothetical protein
MIGKRFDEEVTDSPVKPKDRAVTREANKPGDIVTISSYPVSSEPRNLPGLPLTIGGVLAFGVVISVGYLLWRR